MILYHHLTSPRIVSFDLIYHAYQGAGGSYQKYVGLNDLVFGRLSDANLKLNTELTDSGSESNLESEATTAIKNALKDYSGKEEAYKTEFERVYNNAKTADSSLSANDFSSVDVIKGKLTELDDEEEKSAYAVAAYKVYKKESDPSKETKAKEAGARAAAKYAAGKNVLGEKFGASPLDVPATDFGKKAAGYAMTFGIFWNNLFSVYFLYLMDAHLSNFFMYTGLDVYPSYR
ncbi:hypothetical protein BdWA1_001501 [Babesia duncani]|uniref:Uncharacterized protein n=1 Tax=Babesia duncani TaxID=323732 RepID=A0AAD9PKX1_9APIC|nr:hypothetical protein BdWA1_001500 [Babesia duncani]KAK2196259.1 hypothetical protein BdWA1_001501 [Babesia duncani]